MPSSILNRFTGLVLAATLVPAITLVGASVYLNQRANLVMEQRVQETLNLAINLEHSLIDAHLNQMKDRAVALAANPLVIDGLAGGAVRQDVLNASQEALPGADLLVVVDRAGVVAGRAGTVRRGDAISYGGFIPSLLQSGTAAAAVTRIPQAELAAEPGVILAQVRVPVLKTEAATDPRVGTTLDDGLALVGAAPVKDSAGNVLGAVIVSDLLNNDFRIVDDVTSRSPVGLPLHATIALDGVRVTTNVPAPGGGRRAVGTLYSDLVMGSLRAGQEYRGRALVGGHVWERTIYVPLTDQAGRVVAGSFVGVPEESFTALVSRTRNTIWVALGVAFLSLAGAGLLAYRLALRGIVRPLRSFTAVLDRGDLDTRVETDASTEMHALAWALNGMTARIRRTVDEVAGVSRGVLAASDQLAAEARQTAANAESALTVAAGALEASEQVGENAQRAISRVRELELALSRIGSSTREQARAIRHAAHAIEQMESSAAESRRMLATVLESTRSAVGAVQQGRQSALATHAALELVRLADGDRTPDELDRAQGAANSFDQALREIARATEETTTKLWELSAVLGEAGARVGAVTQQLSAMSGVAEATAGEIGTSGEASRAMLADVESVAATTVAGVDRVRQAQRHVTSIAESNRRLSDLSDRIRDLAHELDRVAGGFQDR